MAASESDTTTPFPDEDDAPAWSDDAFSRAEVRHGDSVLRPAQGPRPAPPPAPAPGPRPRRGRPPSTDVKRQVTLRLDADVLDHFRSGGPGWQSRINAALKKAAQA